jgi:hypothetical protein
VVKKLTTKSSRLRVKASMPPATTAGAIIGKVTCQKVCQEVAPRSCAASSTAGSMPTRRERTTIATKGIWKVTCDSTIVVMPSEKSPNWSRTKA